MVSQIPRGILDVSRGMEAGEFGRPAGILPVKSPWGHGCPIRLSREIARGFRGFHFPVNFGHFPGNPPGDSTGNPGASSAFPWKFPAKRRETPREIWTRPSVFGRLGPFWGKNELHICDANRWAVDLFRRRVYSLILTLMFPFSSHLFLFRVSYPLHLDCLSNIKRVQKEQDRYKTFVSAEAVAIHIQHDGTPMTLKHFISPVYILAILP